MTHDYKAALADVEGDIKETEENIALCNAVADASSRGVYERRLSRLETVRKALMIADMMANANDWNDGNG